MENLQLSKNAARQLLKAAQSGDDRARQIILAAHQPFIIYLAGQFYRPNGFFEMADLIQQGSIGLLRAIEKFNLRKRSRGRQVLFVSYARYWISHMIRREIHNHGLVVSVPVYKQQAHSRARREGHHNLPTYVTESISLDATSVYDQEKQAFELPADSRENPDRVCEQSLDHEQLRSLLDQLPLRERAVVLEYFGLHGQAAKGLKDIGEGLGVCKERIRQLKTGALRRVRHSSIDAQSLPEKIAEMPYQATFFTISSGDYQKLIRRPVLQIGTLLKHLKPLSVLPM